MKKLNKVIRIAGMKRNGNHGIANWILAQHRGKATFRNAAIKFEQLGNVKSDPIEAFQTEGLEKVNLDDPGDKELFLVTYEDKNVTRALDPQIAGRYEQWIGHKVGRVISVVILRDPYNFFSSRIQAELNGTYPIRTWGPCFSRGGADRLWAMWKSYAQKFLEFEQSDNLDEVAISYDHWVSSLEYRNRLASRLGIGNDNDSARLTVTGWGAGSSFDGRVVQQPSSYLSRWEKHCKHPEFERMLRDEEIAQLSEQIFGGLIQAPSLESIHRDAEQEQRSDKPEMPGPALELEEIEGCIPINEKGAWRKRAAPSDSLHYTARIFDQIQGQTIIELGTGLHGHRAGNSVLVWTEHTNAKRIIAVDLEQKRLDQVREATREHDHVEVVLQDGISFVRGFDGEIDLLYLDFWVEDPPGTLEGTGRAEAYREVFFEAKDKFSEQGLILIDDTDHVHPWKHTYIVPLAREAGFRVIYTGRQTLLRR